MACLVGFCLWKVTGIFLVHSQSSGDARFSCLRDRLACLARDRQAAHAVDDGRVAQSTSHAFQTSSGFPYERLTPFLAFLGLFESETQDAVSLSALGYGFGRSIGADYCTVVEVLNSGPY